MEVSLVNLFGIAIIAFTVPFVLGSVPGARISCHHSRNYCGHYYWPSHVKHP